jgi:O-antigen ligase
MKRDESSFDPAKFLANAHACCAGAWIAGVGLFLPMEAFAFTALALLSVLRWRSVLDAIADPAIRTPLLFFGCLMVWMLLATMWCDSITVWSAEPPHRTFLGVLLVLGARMPVWGLLSSISVAGLWWIVGMLVSGSGLADGRLFVPSGPSVAFLGLSGLAAAGIACLASGLSRPIRVAGAFGFAASLLGLAHVESRTSIVSVLLGATFVIATAAFRKGNWRRAVMVSVAIAVFVAIAIPSTPVWQKARSALAREVSSEYEDHPDALIRLYRKIDPSRAFLHEWTMVRIPERPVIGHGAGSWRHDWPRREPHETQPPGRYRHWWDQMKDSVVQAHSVYLQVLYEYGLIGLAFLLAAWGSLIVSVFRRTPDIPSMASLAILVEWAVHRIADGPLNHRVCAATFAVVFALIGWRGELSRSDPAGSDGPGS